MAKVRRTFYVDAETSRLLDLVAEGQDAKASPLAERLIREGLERRLRLLETVEGSTYAALGVIALGLFAAIPALV